MTRTGPDVGAAARLRVFWKSASCARAISIVCAAPTARRSGRRPLHASAAGGVRNVVLVHGGFVDGSGWEGVYRALNRRFSSATRTAEP